MRVVVLVPRRADNGHRDRLWVFCWERWDRFGWPIIEGASPDGPFNRSAAINDAARQAGEWDVAVIIDSDVVTVERSVHAAVDTAAATGRMVVAHDERVMLSKSGTKLVLGGLESGWRDRRNVERVWMDSVSCCVAVPRVLWDRVGGFDEKFVGWGREDTGFRIACEAFSGPILKVSGETFHLWHPPAPEVAQTHPLRKANEHRHQQYVEARWDREKVEALLAEVELTDRTIPRILHRTVPKDTSAEVEEWWSRFEQLHPGWELRTHREPLRTRDWPLTGDLFAKCQNGAQKAGLIRLECLVTHGGVYVDSDVEPFRSFEPLLDCQAFAGWEDESTVPDAVLGAKPEHPAFVDMLDRARQVVADGGDAWKSGPGVMTDVLPGRTDVTLFPPGAFYPYHYLQKARRRNVTAASTPYAFCAHHWHHSWGSDDQKRSIEKRQRR